MNASFSIELLPSRDQVRRGPVDRLLHQVEVPDSLSRLHGEIGTRVTETLNPKFLSCLPHCIRFNLLKNGSQSLPALEELAMTTNDTEYLVRSTSERPGGTRSSHCDLMGPLVSLLISLRIPSRKWPSPMNVVAETTP